MPAESGPADAGQRTDGGPENETALDLSRPRHIHVVGAGGAGMSAIASVLFAMGHVVTGSDLKTSATLERLAASGVRVHVGHDAAHIGDAEVVAVSTAIPDSNPEVVEARRRGLPVLSRAQALAAIAARSTVRGGVGDPRQDHDHLDVGADPDRSRAATELSHRR